MNGHTPVTIAVTNDGVFLLWAGMVRLASSALAAAIFSFLRRSSKYFVIVTGSLASDFASLGSGGASASSVGGVSDSLRLYGLFSVAHSSSSSTTAVAGACAGAGAAGAGLFSPNAGSDGSSTTWYGDRSVHSSTSIGADGVAATGSTAGVGALLSAA